MKKMMPVYVMVTFLFLINTQAQVPAVNPPQTPSLGNFIKPLPLGDINKTSGGITDMLMSKLSLPTAQKSKLTDVISGFLKNKQGIMSLADTNPSSYLSKFNPLQKGLFDKMKGIMGASKFASFLGLKPKAADAGNLLSHLFF